MKGTGCGVSLRMLTPRGRKNGVKIKMERKKQKKRRKNGMLAQGKKERGE